MSERLAVMLRAESDFSPEIHPKSVKALIGDFRSVTNGHNLWFVNAGVDSDSYPAFTVYPDGEVKNRAILPEEIGAVHMNGVGSSHIAIGKSDSRLMFRRLLGENRVVNYPFERRDVGGMGLVSAMKEVVDNDEVQGVVRRLHVVGGAIIAVSVVVKTDRKWVIPTVEDEENMQGVLDGLWEKTQVNPRSYVLGVDMVGRLVKKVTAENTRVPSSAEGHKVITAEMQLLASMLGAA